MTKTKITEQQARDAMKDWLDADAKLAKTQAEKREKITPIVQKYEAIEREHSDRKKAAEDIIEAYADQNRDALLPDGKKSVGFEGGKIGYKTSPAKLVAENDDWDKALTVAAEELPNFVIEKMELDKAGILRNAEALADLLPKCGLSIEQKESFFVKS